MIRKKPSYRLKARLIQESAGKCAFCPFSDAGRLEFHHIDEDSSNTVFENLIAVCPNCHSSIGEGLISQEAVIDKKKQLLITVSTFFKGNYKFDDFSIRENRVSIFTFGMTMNEVYRILPREQILKTVGYGEHPGEDAYDDYLIYDFDGTLLLILTSEMIGSMNARIATIKVESKKFATISGIKIGSTYKHAKSQEHLTDFQPDFGSIICSIEWLKASFSFKKEEFIDWGWDETKNKIDPHKIQGDALIESISIHWLAV
jgi:hypothetical protein